MSGEVDERVLRAMRAVERRVAAAAGIAAPTTQPEGGPVLLKLNRETAPLMFAGTGISADAVLQAMGNAVSMGPATAATMCFWLGYELATDGES